MAGRGRYGEVEAECLPIVALGFGRRPVPALQTPAKLKVFEDYNLELSGTKISLKAR